MAISEKWNKLFASVPSSEDYGVFLHLNNPSSGKAAEQSQAGVRHADHGMSSTPSWHSLKKEQTQTETLTNAWSVAWSDRNNKEIKGGRQDTRLGWGFFLLFESQTVKVAPEKQRPVCLASDQKTSRTVLRRRIDLPVIISQGNHASKSRALAELWI